MAKISIVGAGAVGTAIALKLQSLGHDINLIAENLPGRKQITSDLAAGIGCIFKPSSPLVAELVLSSYEDYMQLARDPGCRAVHETKLHIVTNSREMPEWARNVKDYTVVSDERAHYGTYSFNPGLLGAWRMQVLKENGATLQERALVPGEVSALKNGEKLQGDDYTILTMGLQTRDVLPELKLYPVRGVLVHYPEPRRSKISESFMHEDTATYVVDRPGGPIIGGTFDEYIGSCSDTEKLNIGERITERALREFTCDGLSWEDFQFSLRRDITAGYRPAVSGDPVIDYGSKDMKIAVVTGLGGQGWVSGFELARRVAEHIESNIFPSAVI